MTCNAILSRRLALLSGILAVLLPATVGCSRDGRLSADGAVSIDGKPLQSGTISFTPPRGAEGHSAGGAIKDGKFHLSAKHGLSPGTYRVTVEALVPINKTVAGPMGNKRPMTMPVLFADKLEAKVVAGEANHFDFQLKSSDSAR